MAKNDQQEAFDKILTASLARVFDMQKFAEAKNAALLAFNTAWTVGIANIMTKQGGAPAPFNDVLPIAGALFVTSGLIALNSLSPITDFGRLLGARRGRPRDPNLLFFGDIATQDVDAISGLFTGRYLPQGDCSISDEYVADITTQIHANSRIAKRKFIIFRVASTVSIVALAILSWPAIKYLVVGGLRLILACAA